MTVIEKKNLTLVMVRVKAHNTTNLEDSHNAESTSISPRTVADPGHLNVGSTGTGSKASQTRRDFKFMLLNMHHSKDASLNLIRVLTGGKLTLHFFKNSG
jgi:hypothetical protein